MRDRHGESVGSMVAWRYTMAVTTLLITSRRPFAQEKAFGHVGPYEQLDGTAYFAVDPDHPANQLITDLPLAPRDASGRVQFAADWRLLRPVEPPRGNHRLLFDILNRGRGPGVTQSQQRRRCGPHRTPRSGQWLPDASGVYGGLVWLATRRA